MKQRFTHHWQRLPASIRKPVVLIIGLLLIILAGLTGWLPGPGGIPLFLLGIAVLATEFAWAKIIRDRILAWLKQFTVWFRSNPVEAAVMAALVIFILIGLALFLKNYLPAVMK